MYDYIMEHIKYNMLDDRHISDTDILAFMNRLDNTERDKFFSMIQFDAIICNTFGHPERIYNEWVEVSSDVFNIMPKTNGTIIKDFIKRRLDLYAQI